MVASDMWELHVSLMIVGGVLLAGSFALLAAALLVSRRGQVRVELSDSGFRVHEPTGVREVNWSDVTQVTQAPGRLTFHKGPESRVHLIAPLGQADEFAKLAAEVAKRLDNHRGYRPL